MSHPGEIGLIETFREEAAELLHAVADAIEPRQPYQWLTNLRMPFSVVDQAYLDRLGDYKVGKPLVAKNRDTALSEQQLADFNIVGIYTTEEAFRRPDPEKITQDKARKALGANHEPLEGHLAKYLDAGCRFTRG